MTDLDRYEIAGPLLVCRTCGPGGTRYIVKDFGRRTIGMAEMHTEMSLHESASHEVAFENDASANAEAAGRASRALARCADKVAFELDENDYYRRYLPGTAYRDGMRDGMGGAVGEMAGLLGPEAVRALSAALKQVEAMGRDYPELVQSHHRATCDDFTCLVFGHLVDVARAVEGQLSP